MGHISDLETVEPQKIPINVCVMFYNALLDQLYRGCGDNQVFLQSLNWPKCIVVGLSIVDGLFSLLFYCESGVNKYTEQKTLADVFGVSLLLLELSCFRKIVLPYHLRMLHVFMRR